MSWGPREDPFPHVLQGLKEKGVKQGVTLYVYEVILDCVPGQV